MQVDRGGSRVRVVGCPVGERIDVLLLSFSGTCAFSLAIAGAGFY